MLLYNLSIQFYAFIVRFASLFNPKAKKWVQGRKNWKSNLPETNGREVIWFHCASLGEFEQGRPIIEALRTKNPEAFILLTFFSPSGFEIRKNYEHADFICYLPIDSPSNAKNFIEHFKPVQTFFVKYEIWINYLNQAKKAGSKLYLISALFRENHRFFKWYGGKFRKALGLFDVIFVQNDKSKKLLESVNLQNTILTGDTRYDRVTENAKKVKPIPIFEKWLGTDKALIIGSSWQVEEEIIFRTIKDTAIKDKIILAPHEVNDKHIAQLCHSTPIPYQLYTEIENGQAIEAETQLIIVNCIGILADTYQYGKYAYVGGAFGSGLHNILEPACFGLPVIFGPKYSKFPEAFAFLENNIGKTISNSNELQDAMEQIENQNEILSDNTLAFVASQKGASAIILDNI